MFESCQENENKIKDFFSACKSEDEKYQKIIELGKSLPPFDPAWKSEANRVKGCQSMMYLHSKLRDGKVFFSITSDALISSGLAHLLLNLYDGESPEAIIKYPPQFLEDLGITASLTPNRANGLYSLHLRMKQDALKWLMTSQQ